MSNDFEDVEDIIIEQWQKQITDDAPDYERGRGSAHRGSSYLQEITYPPHGASGGQEGGSMRPEEEIEVLGGDNYARGLDILGAAVVSTKRPNTVTTTVKTQSGAKVAVPVRAGFVQRTSPAGNKHTSLVVNKPKQGDDKTSIKNAKDAGNRAVSSAKKMKDHLAKVGKTAVKGDAGSHIYGAAAVAKPKAKLVAKPVSKTVLAKMGQIVDKLADKGKKTVAAADKHAKLVTTSAAKLKTGVKAVSAQMDPSGKTKIKGDVVDYDVLAGELDVMLDDIAGDLPNPYDQGYLVNGSPDPLFSGDSYTGATDEYGNPITDPSATGGYVDPYAPTDPYADPNAGALPGPPDYGLGPAPAGAPPLVAGQDYIPDPGYDTDFNIYSSTGTPAGSVPLPEGAVIYDGTQKFPQKGVGSFGYFHQNIPGGKKPDGGNGSGYVWQNNHWRNWWANAYHDNAAIDTRWHGLNAEESASLPVMAQNSENHGWGPLIGNPKGGWTAGLRYDQGGDQWFWFYDKAPSWATAADKMKRDNQALLDYQALFTAAQTDYTTQQLQDQIDAASARDLAKQQALEDAAAARQMQQEQAAAAHQAELQAVADQQTAGQQQMQDEQSYRQAQIEWEAEARAQQADTEAAQAGMMTQAQIDRQAEETQARIEAQAAETAARIRQMYAAAAGGGGGGDDGGGAPADDYTEDGADEEGGGFEDAKYALDNEDVMGSHQAGGGRIPGHMRGSDKMRARKEDRRG